MKLPVTTAIAGVSFHQDVVTQVRVGDRVDIAHDPRNEYDANACAVTWHGELLGHLPKAVAARMVAGRERAWVGQVVNVKSGGDCPTGLDVRLVAVRTVSHSTTAAGTDATVTSPQTDSVPADGATPSLSSAVPGVEVFTRSGRLLGSLLTITDDQVTVMTESGPADYPVGLVTVESK